MIRIFALISVLALSACVAPPQQPQSRPTAPSPDLPARAAAQQFVNVVRAVEPIAEAECQRRTTGQNCDFKIVVDDRPGAPPNAFQTLDRTGRPIIAFTLPLIADARNEDELAFVMSHEAAHHIQGHIERTRKNATAGAILLGALVAAAGGTADGIRGAQDLGAAVGARSYSKEFELEADALGTVIAVKAGFDPVRGSAYFSRIPDPGNQFLGSHPPNQARIETVRRVAAGL